CGRSRGSRGTPPDSSSAPAPRAAARRPLLGRQSPSWCTTGCCLFPSATPLAQACLTWTTSEGAAPMELEFLLVTVAGSPARRNLPSPSTRASTWPPSSRSSARPDSEPADEPSFQPVSSQSATIHYTVDQPLFPLQHRLFLLSLHVRSFCS
uniref:Uncharacterized protein n=1 Tax=Triticum urartu TaxID=4572 RepID=A0A8R7RDL9_TRIUA